MRVVLQVRERIATIVVIEFGILQRRPWLLLKWVYKTFAQGVSAATDTSLVHKSILPVVGLGRVRSRNGGGQTPTLLRQRIVVQTTVNGRLQVLLMVLAISVLLGRRR